MFICHAITVMIYVDISFDFEMKGKKKKGLVTSGKDVKFPRIQQGRMVFVLKEKLSIWCMTKLHCIKLFQEI